MRDFWLMMRFAGPLTTKGTLRLRSGRAKVHEGNALRIEIALARPRLPSPSAGKFGCHRGASTAVELRIREAYPPLSMTRLRGCQERESISKSRG